MMQSRSRFVAFCGLFIVVALIFSYFESLFSLYLIIPLPGFKLGIANIVVMVAFFKLGKICALLISYTRVAIIALLFGTPISFSFSFLGATFAYMSLLLVYIAIKNRFGCIGYSIISAAFHNIGQAVAGCIFFGPLVLISYLPIMLFISIFTGALNGLVLHHILLNTHNIQNNYQ